MHIAAIAAPAHISPTVSCTRCGVETSTTGGLYLLAVPIATGFLCGICWATAEGTHIQKGREA